MLYFMMHHKCSDFLKFICFLGGLMGENQRKEQEIVFLKSISNLIHRFGSL